MMTAPVRQRLPRGRDRCAGCHSEQRAELDADIVAKVPFRVMSKRYGISTTAVFRHREHVSPSLALVPAPPVSADSGSAGVIALDVVTEARRLYSDCRRALDVAVAAGNPLSQALAAREVHRALDLLGRQLDRMESHRGAVVIDFMQTPTYIAVRTILMDVLRPHPDLTQQFVSRVKALEEKNGLS